MTFRAIPTALLIAAYMLVSDVIGIGEIREGHFELFCKEPPFVVKLRIELPKQNEN